MRILLLTQFFQPEPMFKGLPLARALMARGHQVEVLTGYPNYPGGKLYQGFDRQTVRREVMEGVVVNRLPLYPSHDRSGVRRAANYLSFGAMAALFGPLRVRKPDVIWAYNLITLAPAWTLLRALYGVPVILDVQDLWPDSVLNSGMAHGAGPFRRLFRIFCAGAYRSADRIVAQSPGFKMHLTAMGVPEDRIDVIYNWADESHSARITGEQNNIQLQLNFEGRFNVLFAGTIGTAQALDCVLDAAAQLAKKRPRLLFTLLGAGVDVHRLKMRAEGLNNVQFLPRCSPGEAAWIESKSDALLVHLKDESIFSITIPSKTQSYLRSGRPILIGIRGDAATLVERAGAGLQFEPESPESLVIAVETLMDLSREAREEMGSRGKQFYRNHLSFEIGVEKLERVCQRAKDDRRYRANEAGIL